MAVSAPSLTLSFPQVREVADGLRRGADEPFRWQAEALLALQEAAESYLVHLFEDAFVMMMPYCFYSLYLCSHSPFPF